MSNLNLRTSDWYSSCWIGSTNNADLLRRLRWFSPLTAHQLFLQTLSKTTRLMFFRASTIEHTADCVDCCLAKSTELTNCVGRRSKRQWVCTSGTANTNVEYKLWLAFCAAPVVYLGTLAVTDNSNNFCKDNEFTQVAKLTSGERRLKCWKRPGFKPEMDFFLHLSSIRSKNCQNDHFQQIEEILC